MNDSRKKYVPVVGVGASAGGLEAFTELLKNLPSNTGLAFVLIQHLDPGHKTNLPSLLSRHTSMPVTVIIDKMAIRPNHVYVLPPAGDVSISGGRLKLAARSRTGLHQPIDIFFDSLASALGNRAMAVVLTGTGSDGAQGLRRVKENGGITFAQDPADAGYPDMPRAAIATTDVDFILPAARIAKELARICRHPHILDEEDKAIAMERGALKLVFRQLRAVSGIDFSDYKQSTVTRRTTRRMALRQVDNLGAYAELLKEDPAEAEALARDLLINVTGFFREPEAFKTLKDTVFPALFSDRADNDPVRIWTAGCATGEEAYTVGVCLLEYLDEHNLDWPVSIFATDVNERLIETARTGVYPESAVSGLSEERLKRFFSKTTDGWRVIDRLRDLCVFARQNLAADPPFSRLDLITCRNLLIYLGPALQRQVLPTFQYALKPGGWLLLGGSESIGESTDLFETVDKKHKLYRKKPGRGNARLRAPGLTPGGGVKTGAGGPPGEKAAANLFDPEKEADRIILRKYPPAGFLVDQSMRIIQFRGNTGPYLQPSPGKASLNLVTMARAGMAKALRAAVAEAKKSGLPADRGPARIDIDGDFREINIEVDPIKAPGGRFFFLISCHDVTRRADEPAPKGRTGRARRTEDQETVELRHELAAVKEHLQAVIEEKEASNEELTAANEETRAGNEELQSVNEELQTATEELQASNEELSTVNEELQRSMEKERSARSEIDTVFSSLTDSVVVFGLDGRIVRANPAATTAFGLDPLGLDLTAIVSTLKPRRPDGRSMAVKDMPARRALNGERVPDDTFILTNGKGQEVTVLSSAAPLFSQDKVSGAVVAWHDVSERERLVREVERSEALYRAVGESNPYGVWMADPDGNIVYLSQSFLDLLGKTMDQCREFGWMDRLATEDVKRTVADWERAVKKEDCWDYEYRIQGPDGKYRTVLSRGVAVRDDREKTTSWVGIHLDITERKDADRLNEIMNTMNEVLASTLDFDEMMERLATDGAKALGADACRIALLEDDHWILRFTSGLLAEAKGRAFPRIEMPAANIAFDTGRPVAVDDVHKDPRVNPKVMDEYGIRSMLAVTLAVRGEPLGVIFFDYREPMKFGRAHVDFAAKLGSAVSLGIENARLFSAEVEAQRRATEQLELATLLLETAESVTEWTDINSVLERLIDILLRSTEHGRVTLNMWDDVSQELRTVMSKGKAAMKPATFSFDVLSPQIKEVITTRKTIVFDYDALAAGQTAKLASDRAIHYGLIIPIVYRERLLGLMGVDSPGERHEFSSREIDILEGVAAQAAAAIENARLLEVERAAVVRMNTLKEITAIGASTLDLKELAGRSLETVHRLLDTTTGNLFIVDAQAGVLRSLANLGIPKKALVHYREVPLDDNTASGRVALSGLFETHDSIGIPPATQRVQQVTGAADSRWIIIPVRHGGKTIGTLGFSFKERRLFEATEVGFYQSIADQLGVAIDKARLFEAQVEAESQAKSELETTDLLLKAAEEFAARLDIEHVLEVLARQAANATGREGVFIDFFDSKTRTLTVMHSTRPSLRVGAELPLDTLAPDVALSVKQKRTLVIDYRSPDLPAKYKRGARMDRVSRLLSVPLVSGEHLVGMIFIDEEIGQRPFTGREIEVIQGLAPQAALAIENAQLYEGERESKRFSEALNRLNSDVAATMDMDKIMQSIAAEGADALGCDSAGIIQIEDDQGVLRYLHGQPSALLGTIIKSEDMSAIIQAMEGGQPIIIPDVRGADMSPRLIETFALGAVIAVPLAVRDKLIGVLGFNYSEPTRFSEAQTDFARKLASLAALALDNAHLYAEEKETAGFNAALNKIDAVIHSTLDVEKIMQEVLNEAVEAIGCDVGGINLRRDLYWERVATYGLPKKWLGERLTDEQNKVAALVAKTKKPVIINDASKDDRIDQEFVKKYGIKSKVDIPLRVRDLVIGVIFFNYHSAPRAFTKGQIAFAAKLARSLALGLENARLYEGERRIAGTLQESLLTVPENIPGIDLGHIYRSATVEAAEVGGDFYDVFELENDLVGIVIGDVAGKGVEAATLTALVKNTVRAYADQKFMPASVMALTNAAVIKRTPAGIFVTVFFGILNTASGTLHYCAAGHPPPILKTATGVRRLHTSSPVIGVMTDFEFIDDEEILSQGETLVLYTDGVTEARRDGEFFGEERLTNFVAELKPAGAGKMTEKIFKEIVAFTDGDLRDDTAILVLALSAGQK